MRRLEFTLLLLLVSACSEKSANESPRDPVQAPIQQITDPASNPFESTKTFADPSPEKFVPGSNISEGTWDEALSVGQRITIEGTFIGNDPGPQCTFASTTRPIRVEREWSWLLSKDGRCMWVAGGQQIFDKPSAIPGLGSIGRPVRFSAFVRADDTGHIHLAFIEGGPLE